MSFVDRMAEDVWSDADIVRRTEAMIRSEFPAEAETISNRKALDAATVVYVLDEADEAEQALYHLTARSATRGPPSQPGRPADAWSRYR